MEENKNNLVLKKKITYNIERLGDCSPVSPFTFKYTYQFRCSQFIESMDKLYGLDIRESVIDALVNEFRISLQNAVYGDPAGKVIEEDDYNQIGLKGVKFGKK